MPIALPGDPNRAPQIRRMFDRIAPSYDRLNHLLTFNIDRRWRRRAVAALSLGEAPRVLDLCAGTLDLTAELVRAHPRALAVATDFSLPMLRSGAGKAGPRVGSVCADALSLPFADGSFDAVLCAFGVRNLASLEAGIDEIHRVLRAGGQVAVLEFFRPESVWSRSLQGLYNGWVLPWVGGALSGDASAYRYLAGSISAFTSVQEFQGLLASRGFASPKPAALFPGVATLVTAARA
jgi:ubiquinone/menaquinone biosynthesis methyltransferase